MSKERPTKQNNLIGPAAVEAKFRNGQRGQDITPLDRILIMQHISRKWRRHLSLAEFVIVTYIADRTILWGYPTFTASYKNIIDGNEDYSGIGIKIASLKNNFRALQKRGVITRKRGRYDVTLGLNLSWTPENDMIPSPKRTQNAPAPPQHTTDILAQSGHEVSPLNAQLGYHMHPSRDTKYPTEEREWDEREFQRERDNTGVSPLAHAAGFENEKSEEEKTGTARPDLKTEVQEFSAGQKIGKTAPSVQPVAANGADAVARLRAQVEVQQEAGRTARQQSADRAKTKRSPNTLDVEAVWKLAMSESFPEYNHVRWGKVQRGKIKTAMRKYGTNNKLTFAELIDWSVRNWLRIMRGPLSWMKAAPEMPAINFLISEGVLSRLASVHAEGALRALRSDQDQSRLVQLQANGLSEQEALILIAKEKAAASLRQETEKAKREAAAKLRQAKEREARAERTMQANNVRDQLIAMGYPVERHAGQPYLPHPNSPTVQNYLKEKRMAEIEAETKDLPKPTNMPKFLSWDELQEKKRRGELPHQQPIRRDGQANDGPSENR